MWLFFWSFTQDYTLLAAPKIEVGWSRTGGWWCSLNCAIKSGFQKDIRYCITYCYLQGLFFCFSDCENWILLHQTASQPSDTLTFLTTFFFEPSYERLLTQQHLQIEVQLCLLSCDFLLYFEILFPLVNLPFPCVCFPLCLISLLWLATGNVCPGHQVLYSFCFSISFFDALFISDDIFIFRMILSFELLMTVSFSTVCLFFNLKH